MRGAVVLGILASAALVSGGAAPLAQPAQAASATQVLENGADVSWLPSIELDGSKFFDSKSKAIDPLVMMKRAGLSVARVRLWVDPVDSHSSLSESLALAKRIRAAGLKLVLDLHFSDTWADPAHQTIPKAWLGLTHDQLVAQVATYTTKVMHAFSTRGTSPTWVQIGNEIGNGLLWPDGQLSKWTSAEFTAMDELLNSAMSAARNSAAHPKIMIHLETGGDSSKTQGWLTNAFANGLQRPDAIGLSYYPQWSGSFANLSANISYIVSNFTLPVAVAETAYLNSTRAVTNQVLDGSKNAITGFAQTASGQASYATAICALLRKAAGAKAIGVWWWEGFSPNSSKLRRWFDPSSISASSLVTGAGKANPAMASLGSATH